MPACFYMRISLGYLSNGLAFPIDIYSFKIILLELCLRFV